MKKHVWSVLLAVCLVFTLVPAARAAGGAFDDVSANAWYADEIRWAAENDLMGGVGDASFAPDTSTSRAMIWTILARLSGADVDGGSPWYAKAKAWVMANGVSDGTDPEGIITRQELVTMLYRYVGSPAVSDGSLAAMSAYSDSDTVSSWAQQAMAWGVSKGLVSGIDGSLQPQGSATRAQTAVVLYRMDEKKIVNVSGKEPEQKPEEKPGQKPSSGGEIYIPVHYHTWDAGTVTKAATCATEGVKTYTCLCGASKTEAIAVDASAHAWGGWTTTDGGHSRVCANDVSHIDSGSCSGSTCVCGARYVAQVGEKCFTSFNEAVGAASGSTVKLLRDVELEEAIKIEGAAVTIEADRAVTITATEIIDAFEVGAGGALYLGQNLTVESNTSILWAHDGGSITVDGAYLKSDKSGYALAFAEKASSIVIEEGSTLESTNSDSVTLDLKGGSTATVSGTVTSDQSSAVCVDGSGSQMIVSGGTVETTTTDFLSAAYSKNDGEIIVNGGNVSNDNDSCALIAAASGKVVVEAGTVSSVLAHENGDASAQIKGGTIEGAVGANNGAELTITGGSFSSLDAVDYLGADANITIVLDGNVTLTKAVKIEGATVTIDAASEVTITADGIVDAFEIGEGGTLILGENIIVESDTSILWAHDGGKITVDGASLKSDNSGYALAFAEETGSSIVINEGSTLESTNSGKVTLAIESGATADISGTVTSDQSSAVCVDGSGSLATIKDEAVVETTTDGFFSAAYSKNDGQITVAGGTVTNNNDSCALIAAASGKVVVEGGTVSSVLAHENDSAAAEIKDGVIGAVGTADNAKMTITGGTFTDAPNSDYVADGYTVAKTEDGSWTVTEGSSVEG